LGQAADLRLGQGREVGGVKGPDLRLGQAPRLGRIEGGKAGGGKGAELGGGEKADLGGGEGGKGGCADAGELGGGDGVRGKGVFMVLGIRLRPCGPLRVSWSMHAEQHCPNKMPLAFYSKSGLAPGIGYGDHLHERGFNHGCDYPARNRDNRR
jgi:hypothetical protein